MPAFFNGIFGHKPSPGIVPNEGHFPYGTTDTFNEYLTIGPLCRYAQDLPLMLTAMAGPNIHRLQLHQPIDITSLKVFVVEEFDPVLMSFVDKELLLAQQKTCEFLEKEFGVEVQRVNLRLFRYSVLIWSAMLFSSEDKVLVSKFLQDGSKTMNPFVELVKYFGGFSKFHFITPLVGCLEKLNCHDSLSSTFVALGNKLRQQLDSLLGNDGVLLFPSHPKTAMEHNKPLLAPLDFNYTSIFNVLHMPVTQCPLGVDKEGMPLGIQIAATRDNDRLTLAVARELERGFGGWEAWQPGMTRHDKTT
jgi:fatty acid amide hydrolase 2